MKYFIPGKPIELKYATNKGRLYCTQASLIYRKKISEYAKYIMGLKLTKKPVHINVTFIVRKGEVADLSNLFKNLEQALQGVAYENDKQVSAINAKRVIQDFGLEGVEIEIFT